MVMRKFSCLLALTMLLLHGTASLASALPYGRLGVNTNGAGGWIVADGVQGKHWIYPKPSNVSDYVNSIYLQDGAGNYVETGWDWQAWMSGQPQAFVAWKTAVMVQQQFILHPEISLPTSTRVSFQIRKVVGTKDFEYLVGGSVFARVNKTGIGNSYAMVGTERNTAAESMNGSWTYPTYRAPGAAWHYWLFGLNAHSDNADPAYNFHGEKLQDVVPYCSIIQG